MAVHCACPAQLTNCLSKLRIPTGYWSWIPIASGEPYVNANELKYLEQAMAWSHARGMRVLIDLHGLPGSQNGEESSGHNTTSPAWFGNTVNQGRSDALVVAVMDWIAKSPYRSTVVGLEGARLRRTPVELKADLRSRQSSTSPVLTRMPRTLSSATTMRGATLPSR